MITEGEAPRELSGLVVPQSGSLEATGDLFQPFRLIKVSSVASKLTTRSAQDMIRALIAGERDPQVLAGLARGRMRAKHDALVAALTGMFDDRHGMLAGPLLDQIAHLDG